MEKVKKALSGTPRKDKINSIDQFLPTGVYTIASAVAATVSPNGRCSLLEAWAFGAAVLGFLGGYSAWLAMWLKVTGPGKPGSKGPHTWTHWSTWIRGAGVFFAYEALMVFTSPGNTCLVPKIGATQGENESRIPSALAKLVLSGIPVVAAFLIDRFPVISGTSEPPAWESEKGLDKWRGYFEKTGLELTKVAAEFLPAGSYTAYSVVATYMLGEHSDQCNDAEKIYLIVLVALAGAGCMIASLFYKVSWATYNQEHEALGRRLTRSIVAGFVFAAVTLLTPPAAPCFWPESKSVIRILAGGLLAVLAAILLAARQLDNAPSTADVPTRHSSTANIPTRQLNFNV